MLGCFFYSLYLILYAQAFPLRTAIDYQISSNNITHRPGFKSVTLLEVVFESK